MASKTKHSISLIKYSGIDEIENYYETLEQIGSGSFGVVYKAKCLCDGLIWAVKRTERTKTSYTQWEVHLLSIMNHKNIIFVKEIIETDKYSFMIMEFCSGGSIKDQLDKLGKFTESEIKHIMIQFADAIHYLHSRHIAHRDLKMDNLLIQNSPDQYNSTSDNRFFNYLIKLIDFGLSIKLKKNDVMLEYCGTPLYMSPEIIMGKSYSKQCDIWSMGIVMLSLMLGQVPFNNAETLTEDILNLNFTKQPFPSQLKSFSTQSIMALKALLNPDPSYRCSASEFLNLPWVTGIDRKESINVLQLMKQMSHSKRSMNTTEDSQATLVDTFKSNLSMALNRMQSSDSNKKVTLNKKVNPNKSNIKKKK